MPATMEVTENEILDRLKARWDADGDSSPFALLYADVRGPSTPTDANTAWAKATVNFGSSEQASLVDNSGVKRWERTGFLTVQLFTPVGEGHTLSNKLKKTVVNAFEGHRTPNGVTFIESIRFVPIGSDGNWYQLNVLVPFESDEIK